MTFLAQINCRVVCEGRDSLSFGIYNLTANSQSLNENASHLVLAYTITECSNGDPAWIGKVC